MTLGKLEAMLPRVTQSDDRHLADLMGRVDLIIACTLGHSLGIPEKMAEYKSRAEKAISKIIHAWMYTQSRTQAQSCLPGSFDGLGETCHEVGILNQ